MEPLEVLRSHPLLSSLPDAELLRLRQRSVTKRWKKGEVVFHKGDPCHGVYGVVSGSIATIIEAENGKSQTLGAFGPGTYVGAIAALDGGGYQLTTITREVTCTIFITLRDFNAALTSLPDSSDRIIALLCNELRGNLSFLESILFLDVSARMARLILYLQRLQAFADQARPSIHFSQKEIADLLGCSREWVGKELGKWRDAGIIDIGRKHVAIRDKSALDRLAVANGASLTPGYVTMTQRGRSAADRQYPRLPRHGQNKTNRPNNRLMR